MAAMGTGAGGFPGQHVARIIFEALLEHAQNPGELREVVLSLPNASIKKAFVDELVALRAEGRLRLSDDTRSLDNLILGVNDHQSKHSSRPILADRYVLLEEIGRGGFAIVHLAWDLVLRKVVAIKVLRPDRVFEAEYVSSMKREAAVLMDLSHESILRLYHFEPCERDGEAFLVMEYVPWPSGEKWIADAGAFGLPVSAIIDVGILLCHALHYAHERGVLHLDVKPRNVFVDSSAERAKIADFGLARVLSTGSTKALACWPQGTPAYMAPEQKVPGARLGIQTDVYLVAATLWDFTTGSPPHGNQPTQAPKPDRIGLMNVLRNALRPEPFARPRDCLALAADLAGLRST
jgi:serine/threonine protein kinase